MMQDVYTFAGTDQCQLPDCGPYTIYVNLLQEPYVLSRYFSNNYDKFAQQKLLLSSDVELNSGSSDMDAVLSCHTS